MLAPIIALIFLSHGCRAAETPAAQHTLPEPLVTTKLPDRITEVAPGDRIVKAVSACDVEVQQGSAPEKVGPGVWMTMPMAKRAAELRVGYDELRALAEVDARTFERERAVYQKNLDLADDEIADLRERNKRTWIERNGGWLGLTTGMVLGVALSVGIAAALDGALGD